MQFSVIWINVYLPDLKTWLKDSLWYSKLSNYKLNHYGFCLIINNEFKSFLCNRSQTLESNNRMARKWEYLSPHSICGLTTKIKMVGNTSCRWSRNFIDSSELNALSSVVLYNTSKRKKTGKKYIVLVIGVLVFLHANIANKRIWCVQWKLCLLMIHIVNILRALIIADTYRVLKLLNLNEI